MSAYEEWLALYPDGHPPTREDGTFDEANFYRGRIADLTAERDALAARLATLAAAGIVVGEDGAVRWHGLTGAEIEAIGGADKATLARKLRRVNAENRALRIERDTALALAERRADTLAALLSFMPDSADPTTWEFMDYGMPWMLSKDALLAMDECIDALAAAPPPSGAGNGMAAFAGAWPGDETEEQLLATLDYLDGKGPPPAGEG